MKQIYYFAHPYTASTEKGEEMNFRLAIQRTNKLLDRGYIIYCPIIPTHILHKQFFRSVDFWYEYDMPMVEVCKGLILAPNWEHSKGCCNERNIFEKKKLPILLYNDIIKEEID